MKHGTALINMTLNENAAGIAEMMSVPGEAWMTVDAQFNRPTGYFVTRGKAPVEVDSVFIYITKPSTTKEGFLIKTAFPRSSSEP